jgi:hypothetical protein
LPLPSEQATSKKLILKITTSNLASKKQVRHKPEKPNQEDFCLLVTALFQLVPANLWDKKEESTTSERSSYKAASYFALNMMQ